MIRYIFISQDAIDSASEVGATIVLLVVPCDLQKKRDH